MYRLRGHTKGILGCAISPDGRLVATASKDRTLRVWDLARGEQIQVLSAHSDWVRACVFSPDSSWLVSASRDRTLRVWDSDSWQERAVLVGHDDSVWGCAVAPGGESIISAGKDGTLRAWEPATGSEVLAIELPSELTCVALHPKRPLAVAGDVEGVLHLRPLEGIPY
jgi:WD40 repeat protein